MAKDINGLAEGMELLQEDFDTLYAKAQAAKPSARQIRIGLLRVPGTDPAIDRAIEASSRSGVPNRSTRGGISQGVAAGAARREPSGRRRLLVQQSSDKT
jgi:hypothetical protein